MGNPIRRPLLWLKSFLASPSDNVPIQALECLSTLLLNVALLTPPSPQKRKLCLHQLDFFPPARNFTCCILVQKIENFATINCISCFGNKRDNLILFHFFVLSNFLFFLFFLLIGAGAVICNDIVPINETREGANNKIGAVKGWCGF